MHENQVQMATVNFHGNELITVLYRAVEYVAMKPIVEGMGLSWQGQQVKIRASRRYQAILIPLKTSGGLQQMLCMPLSKLNGWLFSISPEKVRLEIKPTVELYQEECFVILYNYWHGGAAINPRAQLPTIAHLVSEAKAAKELREILMQADEETRHFICKMIKSLYDVDCLEFFDLFVGESHPTYEKKTLQDFKKDVYLTPTQLGRRLGVSPHKANRLLEQHGLIESYRNKQNHMRWRPTEKGRPYVMPKHIKKKPDGTRRQCLMFLEAVADIIDPRKNQ